jgi:hypothetical protein
VEADPQGARAEVVPGAGRYEDRARDQTRTARLLFDAELTAGVIPPDALGTAAVRSAARVRAIPSRPVRLAERVRYRLGGLQFEEAVVEPLLAARRAALGERAAAPPRFLIRVDEFPHYQAWDDPEHFGTARFERFQEIMAGAGFPYLIAVLPRVSREPLSPSASGFRSLERDEVAMLGRLASERVSFGLHGRDHRTRFASPRRASEFCGLSASETEELLDEALAELAPLGIRPDVLVPPYNRFDVGQFEAFARRFAVVCGGPESIGQMGFHSTPQWRGETVYLPSYAPVYGRAADVLPAVDRAIERAVGAWVPVVLHWGWEMDDDWAALRRLADRIAPYAAGWEDFLGAIERSGERTPTGVSGARTDASPAKRPAGPRHTPAAD